jgi:hypothetical protein
MRPAKTWYRKCAFKVTFETKLLSSDQIENGCHQYVSSIFKVKVFAPFILKEISYLIMYHPPWLDKKYGTWLAQYTWEYLPRQIHAIFIPFHLSKVVKEYLKPLSSIWKYKMEIPGFPNQMF